MGDNFGVNMDSRKIALFALLGAGLFYTRNSWATAPYSAPVLVPGTDQGDTPMEFVPTVEADAWDIVDYSVYDYAGNYHGGYTMPMDAASGEDRLKAFLYVLRASEHLFPRDVIGDAAYNTYYGGTSFIDMSDHPVNTGEKQGVPLSPAMCKNAGFANGKCVSTAAGAYQFTRPTWNGLSGRDANGQRATNPKWGYLPDFSKESQDQAAIRLLQEIGALDDVLSGNFDEAVKLAGKKWASLPGAVAKQNQRSRDFVLARYNEALTNPVG